MILLIIKSYLSISYQKIKDVQIKLKQILIILVNPDRFYIHLLIIKIYPMVQGTFVLTALERKGPEKKRQIDYRQTNMRYLVVVIAILVVFSC